MDGRRAPLKHTNAQLANNALRPFFASYSGHQGIQNLQIGNIGNTACLILSGPQFIVANALKLLQTADVPSIQSPHELEAKVAALENSNKALLQRLESLEKQIAKQQKRGE